MTISEVIVRLRTEGVRVSPSRVRYAILMGWIDRPAKNYAGTYVFTDVHVTQLRQLLVNPPMPGRKRVACLSA